MEATNFRTASRTALGFASLQLLLASLVIKIVQSIVRSRRPAARHKAIEGEDDVQMNMTFVRRLIPLLKICIPGFLSMEFASVLTLLSLLFLRTKLTLYTAQLIGRSGRLLVEKKLKQFFFTVGDIGLLAIPGAILHIGNQYTKLMLQQKFRENIQNQLQEEYVTRGNIYLIATQHSLDNPDHRLAQDAKQFCNELTGLFRSVLKPLLDVAMFSFALAQKGGLGPPGFLSSYYVLVATLMSSLLPSFASLVANSQRKEGNLRASHGQLVQHAEEIAFYGGEEIEREHADRLLRSICKHELLIKKVKWWSGLIDSLLIKYGSVCIGYIACGAVTYQHRHVFSKSQLTELYLQSTQLYMPLSLAIGQLLLLHKKVGALCGSTHRVGEMREMLSQISAEPRGPDTQPVNFRIGAAEGASEDEIDIRGVNVVAPDGVTILRDFTLHVTRGNHVLIMGSNGSGKSALMRMLTRLWPLVVGEVRLPGKHKVGLLSQRTYLPPGTLRAQMVYPMTEQQATDAGITDAVLLQHAESLGLASVVEREGGLGAVKNWHEVLSGGERQRLALVRVLASKPVFVFLDECTSAVSQDDEPKLYTRLIHAGITLITISHRESLKSIHNTLVLLDGAGGYTVSSLN